MNHFVVDNGEPPPFTRSAFDPNELKDPRCATRQPSYLLAVGATSQPSTVFDTARELHMATHRLHAKLPQFELGMSRQQCIPIQKREISNMDFSGHVSSFSQQAACIDSESFQKSADFRYQQPVDDYADSRGKTLACFQNADVNYNRNGSDFMNVKSNFQPDVSYRLSEMTQAQKVKNIPRAVIAPMSQTDVLERPYRGDRFSSLPKMMKATHAGNSDPLNDYIDIERSTSKSYGAMLPATNNNLAVSSSTKDAYCLTNQPSVGFGHSAASVYSKPLFSSEQSGFVGEHSESLRPSCWSSDAEKSKTFDDVDDGHSYINPQTVESVLSYQNLARKSLGSRSQRAVLPRVIAGNSMQEVALNDANRKLAYAGTRPNCWPSNEMIAVPFPPETPLEKCGGDRRSASSTSTTCSSQLDSGYSGDRCHSVSLTSTSHSPDLCNDLMTQAGQSHFSHPGQVQPVQFPESRPQHQHNLTGVPQSLFTLNEAHLVMHKETSSDRRRHVQLNSNVDVNSLRPDYRNNHHLNVAPVSDRKLGSGTELNAVREPAKFKDDELSAKPGIESSTEQMKYLSMLQKQIKLYRVKDEATRRLEDTTSAQRFTMHGNALLSTACTPTTQTDRNIVQSSCLNLEKASHDSEFNRCVVKPCSSKINCGSIDFNRCKPGELEMGGGVHHLISKKKAVEQKRVGLGTVESNRDGQGSSYVTTEPVNYCNSANEYAGLHDFQRLQVSESKTKEELNRGRGELIGQLQTNPLQLAHGVKYDADTNLASSKQLNSAEEIVNVWTLMKNERKSQPRKDESSLVSFTSPGIETWKSSLTSFAQRDADNFQVSSVRVAPNSDDNCESSKFEKLVKKSVSFSDNVALIASTEEVPNNNSVDYVEYVTSFLRKRTNGLKSFEAVDDRSSQTGSSSRGSLLSESRSNSSGSRTNSNVSVTESAESSRDQDSDFYENDGSICSEQDSEGTMVDETGRIRCSLCHKRWIDTSEIYCKDCSFYMSKFQQAA